MDRWDRNETMWVWGCEESKADGTLLRSAHDRVLRNLKEYDEASAYRPEEKRPFLLGIVVGILAFALGMVLVLVILHTKVVLVPR